MNAAVITHMVVVTVVATVLVKHHVLLWVN